MHKPNLSQRRSAGVARVAICVATAAVVSTVGGGAGLTEIGGGVAAPPVPPAAAIRSFNPETTSVFTDEQSFMDSVSCRTLSLESFEDLGATNRIDSSTLVLDDFTITTDLPPQLGVWDGRFQGGFATDGSNWVGVEENRLVVPHVTTITFELFVNHFGINLTDYGDFGSGNLEFTNDIGDEATAALSGQPSGNHQFFGIINGARSFRTVTLTHEVGGEFYGIDEITYCWNGSPDAAERRRASTRVRPD